MMAMRNAAIGLILAAIVLLSFTRMASADVRPEHSALPESEWSAIQTVISGQLAALRRGDGANAFAYATTPLQAQFVDPENFMRMVRGSYSALLDARRTEFLEGAVISGAVIQPLRLVLPDDTVLVALYQVEKDGDGRWHIAGCVIAPSTVKSARGEVFQFASR